MITMLSERT
jgi:hypothetical protein